MAKDNETQAQILNMEEQLKELILRRQVLLKELSKRARKRRSVGEELSEVNAEIRNCEQTIRRLKGERTEGRKNAEKDARKQEDVRRTIYIKTKVLSMKGRRAKLPRLREVALPGGERTHFAKALEKGGHEGHTLCGIRIPATLHAPSSQHQLCHRCESKIDRMYES